MKQRGITTYTIPSAASPAKPIAPVTPDIISQDSGQTVFEVSPPGWSGTTKAMKKHKDITNPFALAWYMKSKGDKPHYAPEPKTAKAKKTKARKKVVKEQVTGSSMPTNSMLLASNGKRKKKVKKVAESFPGRIVSTGDGQTIYETYPGHPGRKGEQGGSAPRTGGDTGTVLKPGTPRYDGTPTQAVYHNGVHIGHVWKGEERNQAFGASRDKIAIGSTVDKGWFASHASQGTTGKISRIVSKSRNAAIQKLINFHNENT